MSRNYYTANQPFYINENKVRQIVQQQLQIFFTDIKEEIEYKIKQIDQNILQVKADIKRVQQKPNNEPTLLMQKINQLNQKIQEVRRYRQSEIQKWAEQLKNRSFDRSYDRKQDRSPLFKKNHTAPTFDLNNILFGDQNTKTTLNSIPTASLAQNKSTTNGKPPLPKVKSQPRINQQKYDRNSLPQYRLNNNENQETENYGSNNQQINEYIEDAHQNAKLQQNLSKNKNSFMRKKSLKKFGTIPQQQNQQSVLSNS